ncbi:MAG: hypothetical protein ACO1SX_21875 [Actinomycetota bacterium]
MEPQHSHGWLQTQWSRRPYFVEGGYLRPVPGEPAEAFDPFEFGYGRYLTALGKLNLDSEESIKAFAMQWGLLGLFQHRLIQARHTGAGGRADVIEGLGFLAVRPVPDGGLRPRPSTVLIQSADGVIEEAPLEAFYQRYFPQFDVTPEAFYRNEIPPIRNPMAALAHVCEPLDDFRAAVREFRAVSRLCTAAQNGTLPAGYPHPSGHGYVETTDEADLREAFARNTRQVHPGPLRSVSDGWRMKWHFPSLLSTFYMLLLQDLTGGRLWECAREDCRTPFVRVKRSDQKFCSPTCLNTVKQRNKRKGDAK